MLALWHHVTRTVPGTEAEKSAALGRAGGTAGLQGPLPAGCCSASPRLWPLIFVSDSHHLGLQLSPCTPASPLQPARRVPPVSADCPGVVRSRPLPCRGLGPGHVAVSGGQGARGVLPVVGAGTLGSFPGLEEARADLGRGAAAAGRGPRVHVTEPPASAEGGANRPVTFQTSCLQV